MTSLYLVNKTATGSWSRQRGVFSLLFLWETNKLKSHFGVEKIIVNVEKKQKKEIDNKRLFLLMNKEKRKTGHPID